jgi:very-short-patch-repair endonuclease
MASWYRKPRWIPHGSGFVSAVVGDRSATSVGVPRTRSRLQKFAQRMKKNPTRAEAEFIRILNTAVGGRLRDYYTCQRRVGRNGILDVYFFEHRLGVEIDGSSHNDPRQRQKDALKARACEETGITLIRFTNKEILFGDREVLIKKLREGLFRAVMQGKH